MPEQKIRERIFYTTTTKDGKRVSDKIRVRYLINPVPAMDYRCPVCGHNNAERQLVEIVEVYDEIAGHNIGWENGTGETVVQRIREDYNYAKPICLTPACPENFQF